MDLICNISFGKICHSVIQGLGENQRNCAVCVLHDGITQNFVAGKIEVHWNLNQALWRRLQQSGLTHYRPSSRRPRVDKASIL